MSKEIIARLDRIERQLSTLNDSSLSPFDLEAAAKYLGISKFYLYRLTSQGRIAHTKPGGKRLVFWKSDLDAYLRRNRVRSGEEIETAAANLVTR
jgi:excisionase family DNA binding protein